MAVKKRNGRRPQGWGTARKTGSGRWQVRLYGADRVQRPVPGLGTFDTRQDAEEWLDAHAHGLAVLPDGNARRGSEITLADHFGEWLASGVASRGWRPRTVANYRQLFRLYIEGPLGSMVLTHITPDVIDHWHAGAAPGAPTARVRAYGMLSTSLRAAQRSGRITTNPCQVDGAGVAKRVHLVPALDADEAIDLITGLAASISPELRALVLLAGFCHLRRGELLELRRSDVNLDRMRVAVERGVSWVQDEPDAPHRYVVGPPKTEAGIRYIGIPASIVDDLRHHLATYVGQGPDALLFHAPRDETKHLHANVWHRRWDAARVAVGRPDLHLHDLRHIGLTLVAQTTTLSIAELQGRGGHATARSAMIYQRQAQSRDAVITDQLSRLIEAQRLVAGPTS